MWATARLHARSAAPAVSAWLLLGALTTAPYLRAVSAPPPGTAFLGFFYFVDDQYNYFSYVEQGERGAFFFENKLVLEPHPRLLVNLEWWLVGRVSALLGGRPFLAWRLLALVAALALFIGIDRWLRGAGLPCSHRFAALLLVGLGGGFGAPAWRAGYVSLPAAVDLTSGVFPFVEQLANPHFMAGTALLTWALYSMAQDWPTRGPLRGILLGTALGLVRPYDLVLLVAARGMAVFVGHAPARWPRELAPLLGLLPVGIYDAWVFFSRPEYGSFGLTYVFPPPWALVLAIGPVAALAALSARGSSGGTRRSESGAWPSGAPSLRSSAPEPPSADQATRALRVHLAAWATVATAIVLVRPAGFALQFLVGLGVPLLALGALGLARFPPAATLLAAVLLSPTAAIAVVLTLSDNPRWFVPPERLEVAEVLRRHCRPGDRAFAPPDMGLYIIGRSACRAYVSHAVAPDHAERAAAGRWFYEQGTPAQRRAFLDRLGIAFLALPGDAGPAAAAWLGEGSPFRRLGVMGAGSRAVSLYGRVRDR